MAKTKWFFEKLIDIAVDVVAGIFLYLIVGGYITQPLAEISPYLPTVLVISLIFAVLVGFFYRFFNSVKFHRFAERTFFDLFEFLHNWDDLNIAYLKASRSLLARDIKKFEDKRTLLIYNYPMVASVLKLTKCSYIDNLRGITVQDYDFIGNFLMQFSGRDKLTSFEYDEFKKQWDKGRTIIVTTLGLFDYYRKTSIHSLYWILHIVPFPKQSSDSK